MEQWTGSNLGKEYVKAIYCHPAYLTSMPNAGLDESQAGTNIAGRNINNLRYADDTILMAESWLKTQHSKNLDHGILSHHFMANRWGKMQTGADFIFLGYKIAVGGDCSHRIKRCLFLGRKAMTNQVPLSMGFSRQGYWDDCHPFLGDLPNLGVEPMSPTLAGGFFTLSLVGCSPQGCRVRHS